MPDQDSPRRAGFRQGLKWLLIAGRLTPLIFLFEGLLPSRENTRMDELPQIVLTVGLLGLALAGVARMTYTLLVERRHSATLPTSDGPSLPESQGMRPDALNVPKHGEVARRMAPRHNTPV